MTETITTKGTVARFFDEKGYGFLIPDDQSDDVFVHLSQCPGQIALKRGASVTFKIEMDRQGRRQAVNVQHYHAIHNDPREAVRFGEK
jgi:CspA family cold shock protein